VNNEVNSAYCRYRLVKEYHGESRIPVVSRRLLIPPARGSRCSPGGRSNKQDASCTGGFG
jgi:hypothetical protein